MATSLFAGSQGGLQVFDLTAAYIEQLRDEPIQPYYADPSVSADEQKAKRDTFTMKANAPVSLDRHPQIPIALT